jgi:hypothetical protein
MSYKQKNYFQQLDAVRGILAIIVVSHSKKPNFSFRYFLLWCTISICANEKREINQKLFDS